jgi:hypothetical protein
MTERGHGEQTDTDEGNRVILLDNVGAIPRGLNANGRKAAVPPLSAKDLLTS